MTRCLTLSVLTSVGLLLGGCSGDGDTNPHAPTAGEPPPPQMVPEAEYTPGTSNEVAWTVVTENTEEKTDLEYLVQVARDDAFTGNLRGSGWISSRSHEFTELLDGVTYFYRVKARNRPGLESAYSASVSSTQDGSPPTSTVTELETEQTSRIFAVEFQASDATSGVGEIELWYRVDEGSWSHFGSFTESPIRFTGPGYESQYAFYTVAHDVLGNSEEKLAHAEATTRTPTQIIITDRHNVEWDVTHAVLYYHMILGGWGHGIGQNTIRPIINPRLRCPGDYNYPGEDELFVVLGVVFDGEARAYRLEDMFDSEVVDDTIGDAHIAVTY